MKYIELFKNGFDETIIEKIKPENGPYVGYDTASGKIVFTVVSKEDAFEVTYVKYVTANDLKNMQYQVVDLGLTSGTKWLDRNIGAKTVDDYGAYFSWGNTDGVIFDTVLMTLDQVTELLMGPDYTEENKIQVKNDIDNGLLNYTHKLADYPFGNFDAYNETFGGKLEVVYNISDGTYTVIDHNDGDKVLAQNISLDSLVQLRIPLAYDIMNRINSSYVTPTKEQYIELINETNITNILHDDNENEYVVTFDDSSYGYKDSYTISPELPEGVDMWSLKLDRIIFTSKKNPSKNISFRANGCFYNFSYDSMGIGIPEGNLYNPYTGSMLDFLDVCGGYWSSSFNVGNEHECCNAYYMGVGPDCLAGENWDFRRYYGYGVRGVQV